MPGNKNSYHHGNLRRALLAAAEAELIEKGVEGFSLRAVAKRAGVSHTAPVHHFGDTTGVLTELAAEGYVRFIAAQERRQKDAATSTRAQLAASGLGYIDFATENPALFRLMFSSERPDRRAETLASAANHAFEKLVTDIHKIAKTDPHQDRSAMTDVIAVWSIAHGMADLMIGGRLNRASFIADMPLAERDRLLGDILLRAIPENGS